MGGYGSGQWHRGSTKNTVEDSLVLDINWMTREGLFDKPVVQSGSIKWSGGFTGKRIHSPK